MFIVHTATLKIKLFENMGESMIKPGDGIVVRSIEEFISFVKNVDSGFHIFHQY